MRGAIIAHLLNSSTAGSMWLPLLQVIHRWFTVSAQGGAAAVDGAGELPYGKKPAHAQVPAGKSTPCAAYSEVWVIRWGPKRPPV
jgi:hypothetical protein